MLSLDEDLQTGADHTSITLSSVAEPLICCWPCQTWFRRRYLKACIGKNILCSALLCVSCRTKAKRRGCCPKCLVNARPVQHPYLPVPITVPGNRATSNNNASAINRNSRTSDFTTTGRGSSNRRTDAGPSLQNDRLDHQVPSSPLAITLPAGNEVPQLH